MYEIRFRTATGDVHAVEATPGQTVMEIAVQEGIPGILAECGGAATCATCHVYVDDGFAERVGPPGDLEDDMLDEVDERRSTSRLACQIDFSESLDGLLVEVAGQS
ncbi:2Fe-2S iron-sulfur cluster-binding protein [Mycolicibacterium stellerae]|uniref:2Fe-2S iron-sulfur cluster-binding protein n=1 Tax=Mycolicibacterium stellerae TaxID=2358193 RepID=UPI000F0BA0A2|nr:2Fe-2S iron-sulfur cluster-binding protein [Mycolicibacterium stellerae]